MKLKWHAGNLVIDIPWKKPAEADHQTPQTKMACSGSSSSNAIAHSLTKGSLVEVSSDADGYRGVWYQAQVLKRKGKNAFLIAYQTLLSEDGTKPLVETVNSIFVRPLPPPSPEPDDDGQEFEVNDVVDAYCLDGWWVGVVVKVSNANTYSVFFDDPPDLLVLNRSALRPHWDWVDGRWVRPKKKEVLHGLELQQQLIYFLGCADNPEQPIAFETFCGGGANAVEKANSSAESPMEKELSSWSTENSDLYALTSSGKEIEQASLIVDATFSCPVKKLKEPCADTVLFLEPCQRRLMPPSELPISCTATSSVARCSKQQEMHQKEVGTVCQKKRKRGMPLNSLVKDKELDGTGSAADEMVVKDCVTIDVELLKITAESTGSGNVSTGTTAVNHWNETSGRLVEISTDCAVEEPSIKTPEENWSFPFVKHSSVLRAIESMKVFQKMPQKPHFHHLDKGKEMYLEGLTIGYMLTFANVVEQTSKLQVSDPTSIFNSMFEALLDLESHGFDVKVVRSCLLELHSIKEKHEHFQEQLLEYRSQILEQINEQTQITVELDDVDEEIKMLEERKTKLMSAKEKHESEIDALKSKVDDVNANIQNAQLDFESVAVGLGD